MKVLLILFTTFFTISSLNGFIAKINHTRSEGIIIREKPKENSILKITKDDKYIIEVDHRTVRAYDLNSNDINWETTIHKEKINALSLSPDGQFLLTVSNDNTINIHELRSGKLLNTLMGHTNLITSAVFSPDGKLALTASYDNTARIYEVASGKELHVLSGHIDWVNSAVFSPDGKLALTASGDNTARIYEVASGKELQVLSGHTRTVKSAVFSPDTKHVLTISDDNIARLWNMTEGSSKIIGLESSNGKSTNYIKEAHFAANGAFVVLSTFSDYTEIYPMNQGKKQIVLRRYIGETNSGLYLTNKAGVLYAYNFTTKRISSPGIISSFLNKKSKTYLLLCAIDEYAYSKYKLRFCKSDAHRFSKTILDYEEIYARLQQLQSKLNSLELNDGSITREQNSVIDKIEATALELLNAKQLVTIKLFDEKCTRKNIDSVYLELSKKMFPADDFIFYFSGMAGTNLLMYNDSLYNDSSFLATGFSPQKLVNNSYLIPNANQLYVLDAMEETFIREFKFELLKDKKNAEYTEKNRIIMAPSFSVDNYMSTGGGVMTHILENHPMSISNIFSKNHRIKSEYDYYLYNGSKIVSSDKNINLEIFREQEFYDLELASSSNRGEPLQEKDEEKDDPFKIAKGETLALLVGINDYDNFKRLKNPISDVEKIDHVLSSKYNFKTIFLKDANLDTLESTFHRIQKEYTFEEGSQFLFYFAGHGIINDMTKETSLIMKDTYKKNDGRLKEHFDASILKSTIRNIMSTRTFVIVDACHSREVNERCDKPDALAKEGIKFYTDEYENALSAKGNVVLTSAGTNQVASDGVDGKNSPFARALIEVLSELPESNHMSDSKILFGKMLNALENQDVDRTISDPKYCSYNLSNESLDDRFWFIPKK